MDITRVDQLARSLALINHAHQCSRPNHQPGSALIHREPSIGILMLEQGPRLNPDPHIHDRLSTINRARPRSRTVEVLPVSGLNVHSEGDF